MAGRVIRGVIVAVCLAGCASSEPRPTAPAEPAMRWSLSEVEGEGVKLAFGVPQTDDAPVILTCQPGSDRVRISLSGPDQVIVKPQIVMHSGSATSRIAARQFADEGLGSRAEGLTTVRDPALVGFAASGRLSLEIAGHSGRTPTDDPGLVRRFIKSCSK
jgi:hypothetical protein